MPLPTYGAAPLSKTFALVRILQVISMIIIVGISANFVSEIVAAGIPAPKEVVGTLTIVRTAMKFFKNISTYQYRLASQHCTASLALLSTGLRLSLAYS
jgi:hypothetical protein